MSRKHREISRRWFRIGAYDEQMVKNRASRSARTAAFVAASIASMPAIREMALLMPDAVPACWLSSALMTVVVSLVRAPPSNAPTRRGTGPCRPARHLLRYPPRPRYPDRPSRLGCNESIPHLDLTGPASQLYPVHTLDPSGFRVVPLRPAELASRGASVCVKSSPAADSQRLIITASYCDSSIGCCSSWRPRSGASFSDGAEGADIVAAPYRPQGFALAVAALDRFGTQSI